MDINIGMNLERARKFARDLQEAVDKATEAGHLDFTEYGTYNGGAGDEVTIQITNDDMERPDAPEGILVDVDD